MKIKYLGTGAAEGVPSMFCQCANCKKSRALGGRNLRSRSQALINDELLIDFNADSYWHFIQYNIDWERVCGILITHAHPDHLYPAEAEIAKPSLSNAHRQVRFYASQRGYEMLMEWIPMTKGQADATLIEAGKSFTLQGEHKYVITPLAANHDLKSTPLIFAIECEGKRMLYAHDSGYFLEETWQQLKTLGHFDLLSLDCTHCNLKGKPYDGRHMSFDINLEVIKRMKEQGNVDDTTKIVVNHFSHNGGDTYDDMVQIAKPYGITVSYDSMEVEF